MKHLVVICAIGLIICSCSSVKYVGESYPSTTKVDIFFGSIVIWRYIFIFQEQKEIILVFD